MPNITTLFFDVGGVVLTNGWDADARRRAAEYFGFDIEEVEARHDRIFNDLEIGKFPREAYLDEAVFFRPLSFSREDFIRFMEEQSQPFPTTLDLLERLVADGRYLLATINNESLELNEYRIRQYELRRYFTAFFSSCYVGIRKPDAGIYRMALQILQRAPGDCLFIDDREENVEAAQREGLKTLHCDRPEELPGKLRDLGIEVNEAP